MTRFIGFLYSIIIEILLWLFPFIGLAAGLMIYETRLFTDFGNYLWIFGIIVGLLLDVLLFGPIIVLLNIRTSLKEIENSLSDLMQNNTHIAAPEETISQTVLDREND